VRVLHDLELTQGSSLESCGRVDDAEFVEFREDELGCRLLTVEVEIGHAAEGVGDARGVEPDGQNVVRL
jgi:hypothetical protein